MAPPAATAVRIESRTGSRLSRENILPLAISPPGVDGRVRPSLHFRPGRESCAFSDYILLPLRAALARGILGSWSGAITGLDGAWRKVFARRGNDLANFLIVIGWGRAG